MDISKIETWVIRNKKAKQANIRFIYKYIENWEYYVYERNQSEVQLTLHYLIDLYDIHIKYACLRQSRVVDTALKVITVLSTKLPRSNCAAT